MTTLDTITAFHALRQNDDWPTNVEEQAAALAKALDYQRAHYPVRSSLTEPQQALFNDAMALLALEMVKDAPVGRAEPQVTKVKETSSSGSGLEEEYAVLVEPFPIVAALLARLAPSTTTPGYWSGMLAL